MNVFFRISLRCLLHEEYVDPVVNREVSTARYEVEDSARARFLSKFVDDVPWVHMDIAGHMEQSSDKGYNPKGSKGSGVRLILDVLRKWGKE